ncbi:hypothetical protein NN561_016857 [Cricetulus griseus]
MMERVAGKATRSPSRSRSSPAWSRSLSGPSVAGWPLGGLAGGLGSLSRELHSICHQVQSESLLVDGLNVTKQAIKAMVVGAWAEWGYSYQAKRSSPTASVDGATYCLQWRARRDLRNKSCGGFENAVIAEDGVDP